MIKKTTYFIIATILVLTLILVSQINRIDDKTTQMDANTKIKVSATISPLYDITKQIAGDNIDVKLILPPGASPHTFDPSPSTLNKLQNSQLIFTIGQGIDSWALGIADNIAGTRIVSLDNNISLQTSSDPDEGEFDPHYWLDPSNGIIMANIIASELGRIDPNQAETYKNNARIFVKQLEKKDVEWKYLLNNLPTRDIVTFHDAFHYFANHFDLNVLTTFEPFPGKEPTPSYLQEIQQEINEKNITVLFIEPQLSGASLEQFAKDNNASISVLDPLGGATGRESYIELIDYNVQTIADKLK